MALRGIYQVNMDAKGRLALPVKVRDRLPENTLLVATIDPQSKCLLIYPEAAWEKFEAQLEVLPSLSPAARSLQRLILGHASDLELDGNGRILLPAALRDYAQLEKKIVVVGQAKRLEIWCEQLWFAERDRALEEVTTKELQLTDDLLSLSL